MTKEEKEDDLKVVMAKAKGEETEDDRKVVTRIDPKVVTQVEQGQLTKSSMPMVSPLEGNPLLEILTLVFVGSSNRASVPMEKIVSFGILAFVGCFKKAIVNSGKSASSSTPKALLWSPKLRPSLSLRRRRRPRPSR